MAICPLKAGGDTPHSPTLHAVRAHVLSSHVERGFPAELGQAMWGFLAGGCSRLLMQGFWRIREIS